MHGPIPRAQNTKRVIGYMGLEFNQSQLICLILGNPSGGFSRKARNLQARKRQKQKSIYAKEWPEYYS
jgi:hypothetical protein